MLELGLGGKDVGMESERVFVGVGLEEGEGVDEDGEGEGENEEGVGVQIGEVLRDVGVKTGGHGGKVMDEEDRVVLELSLQLSL